MLTPVDIQEKTFHSGLGYDKKDVNTFFEEVTKSFAELYRSNAELKEQEIHTRKYFYPAVNDMRCYIKDYGTQKTPIAHDVSLNILTLPIYEELALEDVDWICDLVLKK